MSCLPEIYSAERTKRAVPTPRTRLPDRPACLGITPIRTDASVFTAKHAAKRKEFRESPASNPLYDRHAVLLTRSTPPERRMARFPTLPPNIAFYGDVSGDLPCSKGLKHL